MSHPIHPIMVGFPIAFFMGTLLFDVLALILNRPAFWQTGKYLEILGVVSALATAVPGFMDYMLTVPPKSSAKQRAAKHGLINVLNVFIFATAFFLRLNHNISAYIIIGLEVTGAVLLTIAGFMGGTLVYRNQIGVYNRYADLGNWKEAYLGNKTGRVEVSATDELKTDQMKLLHINGKRIVLAKTDSAYVAFDDGCTHKGGSLAGGTIICGTVQCPWHGSQFDCYTGEIKAGPAKEKINTYPVSEESGKVFLEV
jgi:nitrite reductase/ring-hydroxylating ferredoxin subunit/uncharacterized membrane protein